MSETEETKVCPFCAEVIKAAAKKCPHCNSRLFRFVLLRQELVLGLGACFSLAILGWACWFAFSDLPDDFLMHGRSYARHRNDLKVTKLDVAIKNHGTNDYYYWASGFVTNQGRSPWKIEEMELSISNNQGAVDVQHKLVEFVVIPGTSHAFGIECNTILSNLVISAEARVSYAKEDAINNF